MRPHFLHNDANYGVDFLNATTYVSLLSVDCAWFVSGLYHTFIARTNPKTLRGLARALSESALQLPVYYIGIPIQVKNKINEEEAFPPPPYEAGECSSSGSRRPGHPPSTPWSCERAKTKLTTHVMQDSTLCPRQYLDAPLLCRGALCRVSHQPGKYGIKTKIKTK